jgi:hypothetical protein
VPIKLTFLWLHKEKLQKKVHHEHQLKVVLVARAATYRAEQLSVRAVRGRQPHLVIVWELMYRKFAVLKRGWGNVKRG